MNWEDESGFLEQFDIRRRGFISNLFCWSARGGTGVHLTQQEPTQDVAEVLKRVEKECDDRLAYEWTSDEMRCDCNQLKGTLISGLAEQFAQHVINREGYSAEMRAKLKGETRQKFVHKAMSEKPPTAKQIAYLEALGYRGSVAELSMADVSSLINQYKNK